MRLAGANRAVIHTSLTPATFGPSDVLMRRVGRRFS
jgi:hypothetical protein